MSLKNKTYHIITIGCQMNKVDSERLAAFLEEQGFSFTKIAERAALVLINTCGIRQSAEDRIYGLVNQIKKKSPSTKVIITGCLSQRLDVQKRLQGRADLFLPINEIVKLPEILAGDEYQPYFSLDSVRLKQGEKYLAISPKHTSHFTAHVPIGNGCNNFCAYCVVPYARGREVYRPAGEIIKEVQDLIKKDYREIILLAQNVNSYQDKNYDFAKLLSRLTKLPGQFWLRFSSSHPKDLSPDLIKVFASSPKICSHLHLAVQSGNNQILKAMNRRYTVEQYSRLIKKIRLARPEAAITTDVIVGFPGETKVQFADTMTLFKKIKFDLAYIAKYSPRPGTAAYKLVDNISLVEKKRREQALTKVLRQTALANNKKYLGQTVEVLIEGQKHNGQYYGKTGSYKTVLIDGPVKKNLKIIGKFVKVKIRAVHDFGLDGSLVI